VSAATLAGRLRSLPWRPRIGALALSPRLRRRLLAAAAALLVLGTIYFSWFRDSSFVAVERVEVTGLSTSDAERVRVALGAAGRTMTTLHVDHEALERAVGGFPVVHELEVSTDFPHRLKIHVVEHVAAAIAVGDAGRVPVAADGTILHGLPVEGRLPTVEVEGALGVERLRDGAARAAAAVAGAAPAELRSRIAAVGEDRDEGLVAELREGPELIFGDMTRLRAKWAAAARVLADLEASGASYIDLRIPGRPAAGGLPAETIIPVAPAGTTSTVPPVPAGTDPATGTADPAATGTLPPADGTVPPTGTTPPADGTTPLAPGTTTTTPGTTPTTPAQPAPEAPAQPQPTAPATDDTGAGAVAAPAG
jgi:cell division protein FtsQ